MESLCWKSSLFSLWLLFLSILGPVDLVPDMVKLNDNGDAVTQYGKIILDINDPKCKKDELNGKNYAKNSCAKFLSEVSEIKDKIGEFKYFGRPFKQTGKSGQVKVSQPIFFQYL